MSSRNKILPGLSPIPGGRGIKSSAAAAPAASKEYLQAVQTLSADKMSSACQLLLGTMQYYEGDNNNPPSTADPESTLSKLQDMYFQAVDSAEVVKKQQPAVNTAKLTGRLLPPAMAPSLSNLSKGAASSATALRAASLPKSHMILLPKSKLPTGGIKHGVMMRGRTGLAVSGGVNMRSKSVPPQKHKRSHSVNASMPNAKKQRTLSPVPGNDAAVKTKKPAAQEGNSTPTTSTAPPPSALSFLAKLNKKKGEKEEEPVEEEEEESSSEEEEEEVLPKPDTDPNPNARRNPRRGQASRK